MNVYFRQFIAKAFEIDFDWSLNFMFIHVTKSAIFSTSDSKLKDKKNAKIKMNKQNKM
jgi:hypothetical protein